MKERGEGSIWLASSYDGVVVDVHDILGMSYGGYNPYSGIFRFPTITHPFSFQLSISTFEGAGVEAFSLLFFGFFFISAQKG